MFGSIRKFAKDRKGAFAMQFALMAISLTICTGLAIDGGRAFLARFELASALDAAALAVGSTFNTGADLDAIAKKFVDTNFHTEHDGPISLELVTTNDVVTLKGSVTIDTYFMPLVGQPHVTVAAESTVRRGGSNIEVAMALDITGSMNATRMQGLTDAAKILIDEVVNVEQTPFFSKIAIVPWSAAVYVGSKHTDANTYQDLRGTLTGSKAISDAQWRSAGNSNKTISKAGWRTTTGGKTIASAASNGTGGVDWRWGTAASITGFAKLGSPVATQIQVTTSSNHGYSNGQFVRITGAGGSYSFLNNTIYQVADKANKTFNLKNVTGLLYITPPAGSTSSTASSQRCFDSVCNVGVTTTSAFTGLAVGDYVNITGVSGFPTSQTPNAINNVDNTGVTPATSTTWQVAAVPTTTSFTLANWNGPNFGTTMNSGGGQVSECLMSTCRYRVTTSTAHNFSTSDYVAIWGLSEATSTTLTSGSSPLNTHWTVVDPSGSIFYLPGLGKTYKDWTSGGTAGECELANCNVKVTAANHGLVAGDFLEIKNVSGMTGLNNPTSAQTTPFSLPARVSWKVAAVNGNVLTLADSGPAYTNVGANYTSGGTTQCLTYGCAKLGFLKAGGDAADVTDYKVYLPTTCIVERPGADTATDADPTTSHLGINYTSNGSCTTSNYVTPLTSNIDRLNTAIDDLSTGGSTAGQLGIAWAWYMLSPNFNTIWDKEAENVPLSYEAPENAKIAILMTDGEFNFATCQGVTSTSWGGGTTVCDPAKDPFDQAEDICDAMKQQDITIYTVGLQIDTSLNADEFLTYCATSPAHAFLANDNTELSDAFSQIAISISRLRIAK